MLAIHPLRFGVHFEIEQYGRRMRSYFDRDPLIGAVLGGRYRISTVLGTGGMCTVYRAERTGLAKGSVAVKVLHTKLLSDDHAKKCFENEGRILARLSSPYTVRLLDGGRLDGERLYLVTELLQGCSLERLLKNGPFSEARTLEIGRQICASMDEFHRLGIVHCDLKPANIFLDSWAGEELVHVLDFGLARPAGENAAPFLVAQPSSATEKVCGTPGFMSPEQIQGWKLDQRSDIYALGAILFECLAGRPPFPPESAAYLLYRHAIDKPDPISEAGLIDPELECLIARMLEKLPDRRPSNAAEVLETIENLNDTLDLPSRRYAS